MIGAVMVVAGLMLPALSGSRQMARGALSLNNIRQVGLAVFAYGQDHADRPPALFPPVLVISPPPWLTVEVDGRSVRGAWFTNDDEFHRLLSPRLPPAVLRDPSVRSPPDGQADYSIADSFYASPDYWDRATQRGPAQWQLQAFASVSFPSLKGLMHQTRVYSVPGHAEYPACCAAGVRSSVLWADLSASTEDQGALIPGVPNFFHHGHASPVALWEGGRPIDDTLHGVRGRDR
ncbi:MAG: hypothetical protein KF699_05710 [Phycisphaeraceae bacterium]|nr:hypothetical protein [Phycisphaeraceae bacterium]MBX3407900.1 hypothetical protein [Phycisphaeraceae bacterium]